MKKICFITGTRADYGIMAPIMRKIQESPDVGLQVVATNMHLSDKYGKTLTEIENDGFHIDAKINSLSEEDSPESTVKSMAKVEEGLAEAFKTLTPDLVVILGDRYEALAAASAAVVFNIPIAHLHGGETTEGAIDNKFRHAITQLSTYHFASTPQYVERITSMIGNGEKVYHSGAPGAEMRDIDETETSHEFNLRTGIIPGEPFIILAFHPVTNLKDRGKEELKAILEALDTFINQGFKVLVTMPNSDPGNEEISEMLKKWSLNHLPPPFPVRPLNVILEKSLGSRLFHYAMDHASAMVGNSSAALIEAPSHRLGAVNVGQRQKGRAHGATVLDVPADTMRITQALEAVLSTEMKSVLLGLSVEALNPYYKENSSDFIANKLIALTLRDGKN